MKEKVGGATIVVLLILIGIATFCILTSKSIMTMNCADNSIIEGIDYDNKGQLLEKYIYENYEDLDIYPLD